MMTGKIPLTITVALPVAAALVDAPIFVAPRGSEWEVVEVIHDHSVAGSDGSAVTLDLKKAGSGTAPSAGTSVLASTFDLKSTADTPVNKNVETGGLATAAATRRLTSGQKLCMDFTGTLTALAGFCLVVVLKQLRPGTNR